MKAAALISIARRHDAGPNMTPLVDVVMVILIFLMLAGSFGTTEHFLAGRLPAGAGPDKGRRLTLPATTLDLYVETNGDAQLSGMSGRLRDPDDVRRELEKRMAAYRSAGTTDVQVVFHPRQGTRWESLAPLYDAALLAKYEKVGFAWAR